MKKVLTRKKRNKLIGGLGLLLGFSVSPVWAHHSFVAHYLEDTEVSISGVAEEFWFENPHVRIIINVTTEQGETERWVAETGGRNVFMRSGWVGDEIKPGDQLEVTGNASRDGSNTMQVLRLVMPDGRIFRSGGGGLQLDALLIE